MTIDQLRFEFEQWRSNKTNSTDQIPQDLWEKVFFLESQGHAISSLCHLLGISGKQISAQRLRLKQCATQTDFIEINTNSINTTSKSTDYRCNINLNFKDHTASLDIKVSDIEDFLPKIKKLFQ